MEQVLRGGGRVRFYLKKRAASEEAEQPETLTGDSYTDLRRQDRGTAREREGQIKIGWWGGVGWKWRRSKMAQWQRKGWVMTGRQWRGLNKEVWDR